MRRLFLLLSDVSQLEEVVKRLLTFFIAVVMLFSSVGEAYAQDDPVSPEQQVVLDLTNDLVVLTIQTLDAYWTPWFLERKLQEPMVGYRNLMPNEEFTSECKDAETLEKVVITGVTNNAIYCPVDQSTVNGLNNFGMIIIPLLPLAEMVGGDMWDRGTVVSGEYIAVSIIAHEFSHHVVDEIRAQILVNPMDNPNIELIADCLAGKFLQLLDEYQGLTADQIDNILQGFALIADQNPTVQSHGTPAMRKEAVSIGYYGGASSEVTCFNTYWPEITVT